MQLVCFGRLLNSTACPVPQVAVPLPDIRGRTEILEYYLHDKPVSPAVDKDLLARQTQGEAPVQPPTLGCMAACRLGGASRGALSGASSGLDLHAGAVSF